MLLRHRFNMYKSPFQYSLIDRFLLIDRCLPTDRCFDAD